MFPVINDLEDIIVLNVVLREFRIINGNQWDRIIPVLFLSWAESLNWLFSAALYYHNEIIERIKEVTQFQLWLQLCWCSVVSTMINRRIGAARVSLPFGPGAAPARGRGVRGSAAAAASHQLQLSRFPYNKKYSRHTNRYVKFNSKQINLTMSEIMGVTEL